MSNLFKAGGYSTPDSEARVIDYNDLIQEKLKTLKKSLPQNQSGEEGGFVAGLNAEVVVELPDPEEILEEARKEAENIRLEAEAILAKAHEEASQIVKKANDESVRIKDKAKKDGNDAGYKDGMNKAMKEVEQMEDDLRRQMEENDIAYQDALNRLEPELVEVILNVFEKVLHVLSNDKRDVVLYLVDHALNRIDSSKQFLIHVSKEDYPFVVGHKDMLMEKMPLSSEIDIIQDVTLSRNNCLIETDGGVFDVSLDVQLENLISDIKILSLQV